ncbi:hypothetical protein [Actinocorallia libanotica]|uniref:hypothetical protein n=1 Tax=Actinocorallia libanotica TaxID=46162 RepID=UPI0031DC351D
MRERLVGAVFAVATAMSCLAACSAGDAVDDAAVPEADAAVPEAFEEYPDPPIRTPDADVFEGLRTLLLEPVQRGSKTLAPVRVKAGRKVSVVAACLGRGTFTLTMGIPEDDPNYMGRYHLGLVFDCDHDRAVPNGYESRVAADGVYTPEVVVQGDVQWSLRIEQSPPK